jgi:hypothetical protein
LEWDQDYLRPGRRVREAALAGLHAGLASAMFLEE